MKRSSIVAVLLSSASLMVLAAAAEAQGPQGPPESLPTPRLAEPLAAPCYSASFADRSKDRVSVQTALTGGSPGRKFALRAQGEADARGTFDAAGNATIPALLLEKYLQVGKGTTVLLKVIDAGGAGAQPFTEGDVGTATVTALGVVQTHLNGVRNGTYRTGGKYRIAVSGVPFAKKALYGFVIRGGKVAKRFKLGTGDACGFAEKNVVTSPKRSGGGTLYVNAGPKLNKALAVKTKVS